MTHTPGPWTVKLRGERGTFHIPEAQKHEAQNSDDGLDGYTVSKANANLISAAPDMLEALELMVTWMPSGFAPEAQEKAMDAAYHAIAKAKGTTP